jgi:AraC-like DNA-binding protein
MINLYESLKSFPPFSRQLTCKDLLFTNYDCPQTTAREKFLVECNFIAYILSGKRIFHQNQNSWVLAAGDCVFVKKGAHIAEKEKDDAWCVMVFFIPDNFLKQLVQEFRQSLPAINQQVADTDYVLQLDVNEISKSFFYSMLPYFSQSPAPPENLVELKFKELVLSLLSNKKNQQLCSWLHRLSRNDVSLEEVMHNNYASNLSMAEYARLTCKSVPTFLRDFKKRFNDTPAKWIMKKRIDLASDLLINTDLSIADICYDCGFENQTHFSRVFKEKTGSSPLQFRKTSNIT